MNDMFRNSSNPYSRKKIENKDNAALTSSVSGSVFPMHHALASSDSSTGIRDCLEDQLQPNNRKRPLSSSDDRYRLDPPKTPQYSITVAAMDMGLPSPSSYMSHQGESTSTSIVELNPYATNDHIHSTLSIQSVQVEERSPRIEVESKTLQNSPCNKPQSEIGNKITLDSFETNPPMPGDSKIDQTHSTIDTNVQGTFDEYDSNIDWNSIVLQVDLDQISHNTTMESGKKNDPNLQVTTVSADQYTYPSYTPVNSDLKLLNYDKSRVTPVDDEYKHQLIKNADLNGVLSNRWTLLPHQKAGILRALMMRRLVLAFDMGLGKTLVGCVWAKAFKLTFPDIKVFIICPVSLAEEWERTLWEATRLESEFDDKKIGAKSSKTKSVGNSMGDVATCKIFSWAKVPPVPINVQKYIIICDEAHQMQNTETSRTKDTLSLALSERCIGVLLLTGTPMKNGRPSNIFPLLKAVRHPFGDDQHAFEVTFCNGHFRNFKMNKVWDATGSSNLPTLNAHIASHVLCKTKEDCLQDLPPKTREYKTVQVSSRFELQYANAMNELAKVQDLVDKSTEDEIKSEAVLGAFQVVRLIASRAKIDATVTMARSILESESSIVIFTYFVDVAKEVHKKLRDIGWNGEVLAGDVPAIKRQAMVDKFQSGITPVFIATFGAGGVGVTLTAACTIILLDRPWTPGDAFQAEDRVRRIGQTRPVRSIWMRGFDIDLHIDNMIEQKNQNATTVVDGRYAGVAGSTAAIAPKVSLRQLIQTLIVKNLSAVRKLQEIYNPT